MVCRWTVKSQKWAPPHPGPIKGTLRSMLMKFMSSGAVPGARGGRTAKVKTKLFEIFAPKLCPLHFRSPKLGCPDKMFCLASMLSFRAASGLAGCGLPSNFVWEGSQSNREGGALGGPGQPGVNFTGRRQT
eukprot:1155348-Pelagomonas_calceolata.AAC.2